MTILLPDAPNYKFGPIQGTGTVIDHVKARLEYATATLREFRAKDHNIVQFYLGVYIDTHVPIYKHLCKHRDLTHEDMYKLDLQPENKSPYSQLTLPDHITAEDILNHVPSDPIARVLAKSLRVVRHIKHGIKQKPRDDGCIGFVTACVHASILGNYYHAKFPTPDTLTTIKQRIKALEQADSIINQFVDAVLAE